MRYQPISSAENTTGIVFNAKDKVDINYEGIVDQHGWRMGEICAIDKAVVIFFFFFSFSIFSTFFINNELYDIQQIRCLYYNESINNYELGWFYVNDPNKVRPVEHEHEHKHMNINRATKTSQSQVHVNHENVTTDNQIQPPLALTTIPTAKPSKQKRKRTKKNHKCSFCTKLFYKKQDREYHENKEHKFIKPYSSLYWL